MLSALIPGFGGPVIYTAFGSEVHAWALGVGLLMMCVITVINYRGAKLAASFQSAVTYLVLAASIIFVIAGLTYGDFEYLKPRFVSDEISAAFVGVLAVAATAPFWFAGFDTIPQAMGEVAEDTSLKQLPKIIALSIAVALVFYCAVILCASVTLPRNELLSMDLPVAAAFEAAFQSAWLGKLVLLAGLFGLISTWNAIFFAATRVMFSMGRAHMISHNFARVHDRFGSPATAVVFVGLVGAIGSLAGRSAITMIVGAASITIALIFAIVVIGTGRLRRRLPDHPRPFRFPGGAIGFGLAGLCSVAIALLAAVAPFQTSAGFPIEWSILLVWALIGVFFWLAARDMRQDIDETERRFLILGEDTTNERTG